MHRLPFPSQLTHDIVSFNIHKVNEYLKEIIIQEQSRREAQKAEPLEIPKVRFPASCSL